MQDCIMEKHIDNLYPSGLSHEVAVTIKAMEHDKRCFNTFVIAREGLNRVVRAIR